MPKLQQASFWGSWYPAKQLQTSLRAPRLLHLPTWLHAVMSASSTRSTMTTRPHAHRRCLVTSHSGRNGPWSWRRRRRSFPRPHTHLFCPHLLFFLFLYSSFQVPTCSSGTRVTILACFFVFFCGIFRRSSSSSLFACSTFHTPTLHHPILQTTLHATSNTTHL